MERQKIFPLLGFCACCSDRRKQNGMHLFHQKATVFALAIDQVNLRNDPNYKMPIIFRSEE